MRSGHAPSALAVAGGVAWRLEGAAVSIVAPGGAARRVELAGARGLVAVDGEIWVAAADAIVRCTPDGRQLGRIAVALGPLLALTARRIGGRAAVAQGATAFWIEDGAAHALGAATDCVVPVARGAVVRAGQRLIVRPRLDGAPLPLPVPGDLVAGTTVVGGALLRGGAVGLELRGRAGHYIVAIDPARYALMARIRLMDAAAVAWVEGRAQAVIARGQELLVIDLAAGRCVASRRLDQPASSVAVDAAGVALALTVGGDVHVVDYGDLVGTRGAAVPAAGPASPPPSAEHDGAGDASDGAGGSPAIERGAAADPALGIDPVTGSAVMPVAVSARMLVAHGLDPAPGGMPVAVLAGVVARMPDSAPALDPAAGAMPVAVRAGVPARMPDSAPGLDPAPGAMPVAVRAGVPARMPDSAPARDPAPVLAPDPPPPAAVLDPVFEPATGAARAVRFEALPGLGLALRAPELSALARAQLAAAAFDWIGSLCRRAVAEAWDSGRLGVAGALPGGDELAAILDRSSGHAPEALEIARDRARDAAQRFAAWDVIGAPLADLASEHGCSPIAAHIALIVAAPRVWGELARVYAIAAGDRGRALVDDLLVAQLLGATGGDDRREIARELDDDAPLLRHGIVVRGPGDRPFAALSVPDAVVQRLAGERFVRSGPRARAGEVALDRILAPAGRIAALAAVLAAPARQPARIVIRGRAGSGRRTLAAALAATAGRLAGLIDALPPGDAGAPIDARLRGELCEVALRGHLPCVSGVTELGDDPGVRARVARVLDDHPGPLVIRCAPASQPPLAPGFVAIDLDPLDGDARVAAWTRALADRGAPTAPAAALANRWSVGPGVCAQVAAAAAPHLPLDPAGATGALDEAVRRHRADQLSGFAEHVTRLAAWDDLVLPDDLIASLRELIARVRHRDLVMRGWGMARVAATARGVSVLFQGGPGTGKTLAAGVLARELGYDLYRVDLSRVLSRWLGETEKNLARVFDAAEDGETILLFDEADALFSKRTEVRSSHDRYANIETNYLLSRLDSFAGIAILTTNFGTSIDPALRRRLTLQLQFPFPDDAERERLWRAHLPPSVPTAGDLALAALSARFQLSGGYVRNAALRACYLAAGEGRPLDAGHLVRAVQLEYRDKAKVAEGGPME